MIASAAHGFAFIHIPKNGGSSIRDQISDIDDFGGRFHGTRRTDALGNYDASHVPLDVLATHFPEALELIEPLETHAITRSPVDRFVSALAQRARQFHDVSPDRIAPDVVRRDIDAALDAATTAGPPDLAWIHFLPQSRFVDLEGRRVVDRLWPLENMAGLARHLAQVTARPLIEDFHANRTVTFRYPATAALLTAAKDAAKRVLPVGPYDRLRRTAMSVLTTPGSAPIQDAVRSSDTVMRRIGDIYGRDGELHETARAEAPVGHGGP